MPSDGSDFTDPGLPPTLFANSAIPIPRFVVLLHSFPHPHWDWMFEVNGALATFRSAADCLDNLLCGFRQSWTQLPPHRLIYLDYEGPVSGNRGEVRKILGGTCQWLKKNDEEILLALSSPEISGILYLSRASQMNFWETQWKNFCEPNEQGKIEAET